MPFRLLVPLFLRALAIPDGEPDGDPRPNLRTELRWQRRQNSSGSHHLRFQAVKSGVPPRSHPIISEATTDGKVMEMLTYRTF